MLSGTMTGVLAEIAVRQTGSAFLSATYSKLLQAFHDGNVLAFLLNPFTIVASIGLLILFFVRGSKKLIAVVVAAWGYALVYHFSIGRSKAEIGNYLDADFSQSGTMAIFLIGFLIVTSVFLYFMIKDD